MSDAGAHTLLIGRLARDLRPVRRLPPLWRPLGLWLSAILWIGLLLSLFADFGALRLRLLAAPDMWLSQAGALLTTVSAGWAALQTSMPGRSARWALLPLPPLALWIGASAAGCLRLWPVQGAEVEPAMHGVACLRFLLLVSMPLGALLGWLLMRAYPLRPGLTASLGGLASAAGAATLLTLVHPFDATTVDLSAHAAAVLLVVLCARVWGKRALDRAGARDMAGKNLLHR